MVQAAAAEASNSPNEPQTLQMLHDIVLRLFHNAIVRLSSLLKMLFLLSHFVGQLACFGEGKRFLHSNVTSLDATPPAKSATKSLSDTSVLRPNFASSSTHCLMIWLSR
ncbi:hypothetical protein Tsp_09868 [Trichinella spiralis]|uniref:hypothetical protein n=1 Tax=Trichinella spiralis TaxID=6334 RepID=UPI0001EFDC0F|nr:hypothetical protein Tsp_09868 [Trichinella spiralis]